MLFLSLKIKKFGSKYSTFEDYDWSQAFHVMGLDALELTSTACVLAASGWATWYWSIGKACILLASEKRHKLPATLLASC